MDFGFSIRHGINTTALEPSYTLQRRELNSGGYGGLGGSGSGGGSSSMQATIGCLSRIVGRTLASSHGSQSSQHPPHRNRTCSTTSSVASSDGAQGAELLLAGSGHDHARLVTAVSGFPKTPAGSGATYNIDHILKGQIGDDAYFIARHLDDWSNSTSSTDMSAPYTEASTSSPKPVAAARPSLPFTTTRRTPPSSPTVDQLLNPMSAVSLGSSPPPTDAAAGAEGDAISANSADVIGVADGVGGWRQYGVDPGQFSMQLMQSCERLVKAGYFVSDQPARLLAQGFSEMQASKKPVIGSSTACLAMLSHRDGKLYTANIGDSGLLVVRDGRVVHRSSEQQHYFNTPYQLSLPPTDMESDVLADLPEAADRYEFNVEDGDVIILATDGIFDNVPDHLLVEQVDSLRGFTNDASKVQACANSIALIARSLSRDENFLSPFAKNARASGFKGVMGGKEDDVTVILAAVNYNTTNATD